MLRLLYRVWYTSTAGSWNNGRLGRVRPQQHVEPAERRVLTGHGGRRLRLPFQGIHARPDRGTGPHGRRHRRSRHRGRRRTAGLRTPRVTDAGATDIGVTRRRRKRRRRVKQGGQRLPSGFAEAT